MTITTFLQQAKRLEIQTVQKRTDPKRLKIENVPFTGSPLKHPYDREKVILVADPFSSNTYYYEFKTEDITVVEELPSLVNMEGESIQVARVWVKKQRIGMRCTPFVVEDINTLSSSTG